MMQHFLETKIFFQIDLFPPSTKQVLFHSSNLVDFPTHNKNASEHSWDIKQSIFFIEDKLKKLILMKYHPRMG